MRRKLGRELKVKAKETRQYLNYWKKEESQFQTSQEKLKPKKKKVKKQ